MSDRICRLDEEIANQIAAGEVVERPASVVKELLENALDAGAEEIEVAFRQGGKQEIEVRDDGRGIPAGELPMTIQRHATSKIRTEEDLRSISTLGFRGEALASIASVAEVRILSRPSDAPEARELVRSPGEEPDVRPAARAPGTTVTVRNLFQDVPARRRHLKTDATERRHLLREVQNRLLAHPGVRFRVLEEDEELWSVPPGDLGERMGIPMDSTVSEHLIRVDRLEPDWEGQGRYGISGMISDGEAVRGSRQHQWFFVNSRPVRDPMLFKAVSRAYEPLRLGDRHPVLALFLDVPADQVDVNVHPRKEEVRFHAGQAVFRLVHRTLRERLRDHQQKRAEAPIQVGSKHDSADTPEASSDGESTASDGDTEPELFDGTEEADPTGAGPSVRVLGQLRRTFLLVERPSGLLLVDQHTAHERLLYERFHERLGEEVNVQYLSVPLQLELDPGDRRVLLERADELEELGLVIEDFGSGSVAIQGVPGYLGRRAEDRKALFGMLEEYMEWEQRGKLQHPADDMVTIMACRSAVMRGDRMLPREQEELVQGLNQLDFPARCPHGRPVFHEVDNDTLTSWFDRPKRDLCGGGTT